MTTGGSGTPSSKTKFMLIVDSQPTLTLPDDWNDSDWEVWMWGAGGNGGAGYSYGSTQPLGTPIYSGGGGGGGTCVRAWQDLGSMGAPGANIAVTIGAGGSGTATRIVGAGVDFSAAAGATGANASNSSGGSGGAGGAGNGEVVTGKMTIGGGDGGSSGPDTGGAGGGGSGGPWGTKGCNGATTLAAGNRCGGGGGGSWLDSNHAEWAPMGTNGTAPTGLFWNGVGGQGWNGDGRGEQGGGGPNPGVNGGGGCGGPGTIGNTGTLPGGAGATPQLFYPIRTPPNQWLNVSAYFYYRYGGGQKFESLDNPTGTNFPVCGGGAGGGGAGGTGHSGVDPGTGGSVGGSCAPFGIGCGGGGGGGGGAGPAGAGGGGTGGAGLVLLMYTPATPPPPSGGSRRGFTAGNLITIYAEPNDYVAQAVTFDGTQDLHVDSFNCTDGQYFAMNFWYKGIDTSQIPTMFIVDAPGSPIKSILYAVDDGSNYFWDLFLSTVGETNTAEGQSTELPQNDLWHQLIVAAKTTGVGSQRIAFITDGAISYVDVSGSGIAFNAAFNGLSLDIGQDGDGDNVVGSLADLWMGVNVDLFEDDGTVAVATVRKFRDAQGKPVNPVNFPPGGQVLFSGNATTFPVNQYVGNVFTLTGTLANTPTSPSD